MDELIEPVAAGEPARKAKAAGGGDAGIGELRPEAGPDHRRRPLSVTAAMAPECSPTRSASLSAWSSGGAGLDRAAVADAVAGVAGGRAKRRRLAQALAGRAGGADRRPLPGAPGRRGPADRAAPGGRGSDLGAGLRRLRQAAAHACSAAARTGTAGSAVPGASRARLRERPARSPPGPGGTAPLRAVPARRRPRPGRPSWSRSSPASTRRCRRDVVTAAVPARRRPGRAAPPAGLGPARPARAAHRRRRRGPVPVGAAADRRSVDAGASGIVRPACPRCGRVIHSAPSPIDGQWVCRNCAAKSRAEPCARCGAVREAATRDEHGHAAVSALPDHRPGQPGNLHRLRSPPSGQRPHRATGRCARPAGR